MKYTREQLEQMPLNRLRNIDISSGEEEMLVQSVIDEKLLAMPVVGVPLVFTASMTDNMTAEKEAALQAKMDEHNAQNRAMVEARYEQETVPEETPGVIEPTVPVGDEPVPLEVPEAPVEAKKKAGRPKKIIA